MRNIGKFDALGVVKVITVITVALVLVTPSSAQDCSYGRSCGPVPWRIDGFPMLYSPTPLPTQQITAIAPTPTAGTPTPTATVTPTPTISIDMSGVSGPIATLRSMIDSTPVMPDDDMFGIATPGATEQNESMRSAFGVVAALRTVNIGVATPMLQWLFWRLLFFIGLWVILMNLPVLAWLWNVLISIGKFIRIFLP